MTQGFRDTSSYLTEMYRITGNVFNDTMCLVLRIERIGSSPLCHTSDCRRVVEHVEEDERDIFGRTACREKYSGIDREVKNRSERQKGWKMDGRYTKTVAGAALRGKHLDAP